MSDVSQMDYWALRSMVSRILPRMTQLSRRKGSEDMVREKGRKKNYQQYNLRQKTFVKQERLLNETELNSFLEISIRAQACPMPLNLDVWDGLTCPYKCKYCVSGDTLVLTGDGTSREIKSLVKGDLVSSYDLRTGEMVHDRVTHLMTRSAPVLIVTLDNATELHITDNHELFTQRGWITAGELEHDDFVLYSGPQIQYSHVHEHKNPNDTRQPDETSIGPGQSGALCKTLVDQSSGGPGTTESTSQDVSSPGNVCEGSGPILCENETQQSHARSGSGGSSNGSPEENTSSAAVRASQQGACAPRHEGPDAGPVTQSNEESRDCKEVLAERKSTTGIIIPGSTDVVSDPHGHALDLPSRKAFPIRQAGDPRGCIPAAVSTGSGIRWFLGASVSQGADMGQQAGHPTADTVQCPHSTNCQRRSIPPREVPTNDYGRPSADFQWRKVVSVLPTATEIQVYNIETAAHHNYFANGILTHNCYANAFRASLYTAFFDNSKSIGLRHCNPDFYKRELEAVMKLRGTDPHSIANDRQKAVAMEIPMRFGIRFEDFMPREKTDGISLQLLQYLASVAYPVMINTKSALVGSPDYVEALASNSAGAAVHVTMISSNERLLERLEPGAPTFADRLQGCANMVAAGIRVVSRIEPYLLFVNDSRAEVEDWMEQVWAAGVRNITFDTYSYSADNSGIRQAFINEGLDYERLFTAGADSQALGSLLLGKFMQLFRARGFTCSTFDLGNAASNDQAICCEVGDWFKGGWNYGCTVMAAQLVKEHGGAPVTWKTYEAWVNEHGGFLSEGLKMDVKRLWNLEGNNAYSPNWCPNIEAVGHDEDGLVWKYNNNAPDFREELVKGLL